jgi:hypothetical protein
LSNAGEFDKKEIEVYSIKVVLLRQLVKNLARPPDQGRNTREEGVFFARLKEGADEDGHLEGYKPHPYYPGFPAEAEASAG